jgi:hypothetical protein
MPEPIDAFGEPEDVFCRWRDEGRIRVRGASFCAVCDRGLARPTWQEPAS